MAERRRTSVRALRIRLLGSLEIAVGAKHIAATAWKRKRPLHLLEAVVLAPDLVLHREQAIELLWPQKDLASGANNLHRALHDLQHWGLRRQGGRVRAADSWESDAALSRFLLFGLARHPAHHARSATPFHQLTASDESPRLPAGFLAMAPLVLVANGRARRLLTAELHRKGLVKGGC